MLTFARGFLANMATLTELESKTIVSGSHDVSTNLNYLIPPGQDGLQPISFCTHEAERRTAQREGITDVRDVVIRDIRGREDEFKLNVQGFQYVKHSVEAVTDWRNQTQVKQLVQPATEDLVKRV